MNSMESKQDNERKAVRGGARAGAGRKHTSVKTYTVYATQEVMDILETVSGSKSDFICKAVLHYNACLNPDS